MDLVNCLAYDKHCNRVFFFFQAEDGIRDDLVTGVQTCALPISRKPGTYEPAFILTGEKPRPGVDPRTELGRIAPTHIQFSRAAVNLVWCKLMVVGFVDPYDSFDLLRLDPNNPPPQPWTIQPTNPWLLDQMAKDFQAHNFSLHHLFKTIMKSSAYQLSTQYPAEWKESYTPYYARRFA